MGSDATSALDATGPRAVHVVRVESDDYELGFSSSFSEGAPPDDARLEWLDAFGARPAALVAESACDLRFGGEQPFVREVVRRRGVLVDAWAESVRRLVSERLLDPAVAARLRPQVEVELDDHRTVQREALPPIPAIELRPDWLDRGPRRRNPNR